MERQISVHLQTTLIEINLDYMAYTFVSALGVSSPPPPLFKFMIQELKDRFCAFFFFYENQEEKHRNELNYEEIYELKYYPNCRTKTHTIHVITL